MNDKKPKLAWSRLANRPGAKLYVHDSIHGELMLHKESKVSVELTGREIELALIGLSYATEQCGMNLIPFSDLCKDLSELSDGEKRERDEILQKINELDQFGRKLYKYLLPDQFS